MKKSFFLTLLGFVFWSCNLNDSNDISSKKSSKNKISNSISIKDLTWESSDTVSFDFNIQDTTKKYDLIFSLRTTDAYLWSNIYIFTELKAPNHPSPIKDTVEFFLADKYGNWLGENSGNTISNHFLLYKETQFPSKGDYTFTIQQAMREMSLKEIMDVGFMIIESETEQEKIKTKEDYINEYINHPDITKKQSSNSIPKPKSYYRIDYPEKNYINSLQIENIFPYLFKRPSYTQVAKIPGSPANDMVLVFPEFKADLIIKYIKIDTSFNSLTEKVKSDAYYHSFKANAIDEKVFSNPASNIYGITYEITGNSACNYLFYLSDSINHMITGELLIQSKPNYDSLKPTIDFIKSDIIHLIETFEWNK